MARPRPRCPTYRASLLLERGTRGDTLPSAVEWVCLHCGWRRPALIRRRGQHLRGDATNEATESGNTHEMPAWRPWLSSAGSVPKGESARMAGTERAPRCGEATW